ncbi:heterocyst frequency control protein PatD [filamentous cyanobacterium LEGE 11480]|uniref:Heterocyst frequency control protein PatD n=1 Tax=Romeriopsis navalis LEGE 11480 TaxID=2777977 RepID=A0A928VII3_9CYAN|nr:heterocyst frequency control protein PatD [Romeriopsis navalis]MBE9028388.1 heterocyst frequency control protein PatD [Romeriopsis navalis LEGE 11480]
MGYLETYQQFQTTIAQCQQTLSTTPNNSSTIRTSVQAIEQYFRHNIIQLTPSDGEDSLNHPTSPPNLYGIQVEINKQLRLLKTDCLFLQSAQQSTKRSQRLQQISDRLTLLQRYCQMALGESLEP